MDPIRFGLALRALRRRRRLTQQQVADKAGVSRSTVQRIERGGVEDFTGRTIRKVANALEARYDQRILWQGEGLDRLLDQDHARIVETVVRWLRSEGWAVVAEATFAIRGERGSIDVLAFDEATGSLLVVEVKSVLPDVQGLLSGVDRKVRLAPVVARERGWRPRTVSRLVVLPGDSTTRRRVELVRATLDASLPARTTDVRRWAAKPDGTLAGILFLPRKPDAGRQRVSAAPSG